MLAFSLSYSHSFSKKRTITVLIKEREGLLELRNLFFGKLIRHLVVVCEPLRRRASSRRH
jgi:hypothetical protein